MFTDVPVDVIQCIALMTESTSDYLNIALVCKHFSGILKQTKEHPRRAKAIRHFTRIAFDEYGDKEWRLNGILHRENDKPAVIMKNGSKLWYIHGKRNRKNDKPSILSLDGFKAWFLNGELHRDNGKPAVIQPSGLKEWWVHGQQRF